MYGNNGIYAAQSHYHCYSHFILAQTEARALLSSVQPFPSKTT